MGHEYVEIQNCSAAIGMPHCLVLMFDMCLQQDAITCMHTGTPNLLSFCSFTVNQQPDFETTAFL